MVDKLLRNLGESLLVIGLFVGISAGFNYLCGKNYFRNMPRDVNVSEDFVKPSKIEIKLKDLNGDGKNETIIRIGEKDYFLKYDINHKPIIQEYEIRPTEIISK